MITLYILMHPKTVSILTLCSHWQGADVDSALEFICDFAQGFFTWSHNHTLSPVVPPPPPLRAILCAGLCSATRASRSRARHLLRVWLTRYGLLVFCVLCLLSGPISLDSYQIYPFPASDHNKTLCTLQILAPSNSQAQILRCWSTTIWNKYITILEGLHQDHFLHENKRILISTIPRSHRAVPVAPGLPGLDGSVDGGARTASPGGQHPVDCWYVDRH